MRIVRSVLTHRGESADAIESLIAEAGSEYRKGALMVDLLENLFDIPRDDRDAAFDLYKEIIGWWP